MKDIIRRMKRGATEKEKIVAKHLIKDLHTKYKEVLKFNKRKQTTHFKTRQKI